MSALCDRTHVKKVVLHHLGDGVGPATTVDELKRRANPAQPGYPNGWEYPEYDYGVLADGTIVPLRPLTYIGAHAQADKPPYTYGPNWWNQNSIGVVMANDNQVFSPPQAMVAGTIHLLSTLISTVDDIYPHFQITQTDCPGASYKKLGLNTGHLDYDAVETGVANAIKGVVAVVDTPTVADDPNVNCLVWIRTSKLDEAIKQITALGYKIEALPIPIT